MVGKVAMVLFMLLEDVCASAYVRDRERERDLDDAWMPTIQLNGIKFHVSYSR